jgi:hypothetical protein
MTGSQVRILFAHQLSFNPKSDAEASDRRKCFRSSAALIAPFLISSNIFGGGGCLAPRANATGIIRLEAAFKYGGVRTLDFGPLTGKGRITHGLYVRAVKDESAKLGIHFMARNAANGARFGFDTPEFARLKQPGAPGTYRANSSCTRRRPTERPFSAPADLARRSRRMRECERLFEPSSPMCALPREA